MTPSLRLFDVVRLPAGFPDEGVPPGAVGVVVDVHESPTLAYEVEVVDEKGATIWWGSVLPEQLEAAPAVPSPEQRRPSSARDADPTASAEESGPKNEEQEQKSVTAALTFVKALLDLADQNPEGEHAQTAREDALSALAEWGASSDDAALPGEVRDVTRGLSTEQRAELTAALRSFADWAERPTQQTTSRVEAVIETLERGLGPFLATGRLAEQRATESRIQSEVQGSIARRLREAGASDADQ